MCRAPSSTRTSPASALQRNGAPAPEAHRLPGERQALVLQAQAVLHAPARDATRAPSPTFCEASTSQSSTGPAQRLAARRSPAAGARTARAATSNLSPAAFCHGPRGVNLIRRPGERKCADGTPRVQAMRFTAFTSMPLRGKPLDRRGERLGCNRHVVGVGVKQRLASRMIAEWPARRRVAAAKRRQPGVERQRPRRAPLLHVGVARRGNARRLQRHLHQAGAIDAERRSCRPRDRARRESARRPPPNPARRRRAPQDAASTTAPFGAISA